MRVHLGDFNDVPTLGDVDEHGDIVRFASLDEFIDTEEELAEPLLGTSQETLLPMRGMLLMYGDGGAGKTTLSIDAVAHLSSGTSWLGIDVPRPLRVTLIENEGPRTKFRQSLDEKTQSWNGNAPFRQNVSVLEEPWTRFTLQSDRHRMALALHISQFESDLVVMGPLVTLGMVGGGTPDEVSAFESLVLETRKLTSRPFSLWMVHHENKAGDVSGAWERVPDTLAHVQAQGNGHTRLHWRKARWSSENHGTSLDLIWAPGRSFVVKEDEPRDPWDEMLRAFTESNEWRTAKEAGKLIHYTETEAKKVLAELTRRGEMEFEIGPHGRHPTARCWRLLGARADSAHLSAPSGFPPSGGAREYPPLPFRGGGTPRTSAESSSEAALQVRAPAEDADDEIPF